MGLTMIMKPPPTMTKEEFVAELQRLGFRVETMPNGEQIIHGLRLKPPDDSGLKPLDGGNSEPRGGPSGEGPDPAG
jgi:hypothetical protein